MTTARHQGADTAEREDPLNGLLDAFEAQVQALIDNGLEAQVRARFARLLPVPAAPAAARADVSALEWSTILTALRATRPRDGAEGNQVRRARAWVIERMHAAQAREKAQP